MPNTFALQLSLFVISLIDALKFTNVKDASAFSCPSDLYPNVDKFTFQQTVTLPGTHLFLCVGILLTENPIYPLEGFQSWMYMIGCFLLINLLITVYEMAYCYPDPEQLGEDGFNMALFGSFTYLLIEQVCVVFIIYANIIFMLLRGCCRHKVTYTSLPAHRQIAEIDTIFVMKTLMNQFSIRVIAVGVMKNLNFQFDLPEYNAMAWFSYTSLVLITLLIFVHWRKGPSWWVKISKPLFLGILVTDFFLLPVGTLIVMAFYLKKVNTPENEFLKFYNFLFVWLGCVAIGRLVDLFFTVRPMLMEQARALDAIEDRNTLALKEQLLEGESNEDTDVETRVMAMAIKERLSERLPYAEIPRGFG